MRLDRDLIAGRRSEHVQGMHHTASVDEDLQRTGVADHFHFHSGASGDHQRAMGLPLAPPIGIVAVDAHLGMLQVKCAYRAFAFTASEQQVHLLRSRGLKVKRKGKIEMHAVSGLDDMPLPVAHGHVFLGAHVRTQPIKLRHRTERQRQVIVQYDLARHRKRSAPSLLVCRAPVFPEWHPIPAVGPANGNPTSLGIHERLRRIEIEAPVGFTGHRVDKAARGIVDIANEIHRGTLAGTHGRA